MFCVKRSGRDNNVGASGQENEMVWPATMKPHRPVIMARRHLVVSGHHWASQAGFEILEAGGNAIDAGVATCLAIEVLESEFVGLGGIAPVTIYLADEKRVVTFGGVGTWPKAISCDYFWEHHAGRIPNGILQSLVPAVPDTLITALELFGTMSFSDVARAAIRFAAEGFPMYPFMAEMIAKMERNYRRWPTAAEIYLPQGRLPQTGEIFVQRDLGRTLQYMCDEEAAQLPKGRRFGLQAARDAFYRGDIATWMVEHQRKSGGLLTVEDLAECRAVPESPCHVRFADAIDIFTCGPCTQGPMILEALSILDGIDLLQMGHNTPPYIHTVVEALKLAAADREAYFGDPNFVAVPLQELMSKRYASERRRLIRPGRAWPEMPPFGRVAGYTKSPWQPDPSTSGDEATPLETSYLCVVDARGNVFSATPSDAFMSFPVVPGTGIMPCLWGEHGYTGPDHPACVGPGRRPRMSANPALAIQDGTLIMPFGSPGSEVLGQAMLQIFLNIKVVGMDVQSAVEAPRFASYSWPGSALPHAYYPGRLNLERGIGSDVGEVLGDFGHSIEWWPDRAWLAGSACAILLDMKTGLRQGAADSRRAAYAVGW